MFMWAKMASHNLPCFELGERGADAIKIKKEVQIPLKLFCLNVEFGENSQL